MFDNVRERRKDFKYTLRACRNANEKHKADTLANSMQDQSPRKFWQNIKQDTGYLFISYLICERCSHPQWDANGNEAVAVMWTKLKSPLDSLQNSNSGTCFFSSVTTLIIRQLKGEGGHKPRKV